MCFIGVRVFEKDETALKMWHTQSGHEHQSLLKIFSEWMNDNRRIFVRDMARTLQISIGSFEHITHEELKYKKVCANWISRLFSVEQKDQRVQVSTHLLNWSRQEILPNPPYNPHLSSCDFYLFGSLKEAVSGIRFRKLWWSWKFRAKRTAHNQKIVLKVFWNF